jgi:surfeit locus 1 family protein
MKMRIAKTGKVQLSILLTNWQITINFLLFVVFVAILYGLIRLGIWQSDRRVEKEQLIASYQANSALPFKRVNDRPTDVVDYQNIEVVGEALATTVFVANESYNGRDGYHVLNPVVIDSNVLVWVNRGWIPTSDDRRDIPKVDLPPTRWQVQGQAYYSKGKPILFEHALQQVDDDRWLIQGLDYQLLATIKHTGQLQVLPYIIRLAAEQEYGYIREWNFVTATPPEKHLAYSIQWFGLALAWTILMLYVTVKRRDR